MQLRSGRSLLRRHSRNMEEFAERKKYQEEQRQQEATLYEDNKTNDINVKIKKFNHTLRHLIYNNQYQKTNDFNFIDKVKNIIDLYEHIRFNFDTLAIYFKYKEDHRLLDVIIRRGHFVLLEMNQKKRTREERKIYFK